MDSFNSQPKAYSAALTVRLRLTVKREMDRFKSETAS